MYSQEITRRHRAAIVIAIDQSCSMGGLIQLKGGTLSKAEMVSIVTGDLIDELIMRSCRDGNYRHYYDIALIGYSGDEVYPLFGREIKFYPITTLAEQKVEKVKYDIDYKTLRLGVHLFNNTVSQWVKPVSGGATPMCKMINCVTALVEEWCSNEENKDSFPPLVFNITDGEASDANYDMLRSAALRLRKTGTSDGNTLFMNIHISSESNHESIVFPSTYEVPIEIHHAHLLMDMSSILPEQIHPYIGTSRTHISKPPYIAMSYNASMSELVTMLNIGSRSLVVGL
ncbi:MAG: VWA domain-containing protein [Rikenellaceae bacterium]|nr:VWA domain-containing protein [Rikenellaceae bacterium]